jgi:3-hydroxyacyl-CoA dehydrogenase
MTMHADRVVAAAETYIGLVETGVGVIPGGGGTKELTLRTSKNSTAMMLKTTDFVMLS